jgi:hypothetical protein
MAKNPAKTQQDEDEYDRLEREEREAKERAASGATGKPADEPVRSESDKAKAASENLSDEQRKARDGHAAGIVAHDDAVRAKIEEHRAAGVNVVGQGLQASDQAELDAFRSEKQRIEADKIEKQHAEETKQRELAEARAQINRIPTAPLSGVEFARQNGNEQTVDMIFPRPVTLNVMHNGASKKLSFSRGVQPVPVSVADHQYLRDNGVKST